MKKLISAILTLALSITACFFVFPRTAASAAETIDFCFPLPTGKSYPVTVLSRYSDGSAHQSYITRYVLGGSSTSQPDCVMDIGGVSVGTPIFAVADGYVKTNRYANLSGNYLVLSHSDGSYSYYGHMRYRSSLKVNAKVRKGDIVGYVGTSGYTSGAHLHFEWSGHDPYCEFPAKGCSLYTKGAAAKYPHNHENGASTETRYVKGTGGCLCLNRTASAKYCITTMPEGAKVTVYPAKSIGNWLYTDYNGTTGYAYAKYLSAEAPADNNTCKGRITGTGYCLVINSKPRAGYDIGYMPEGAVCTIHRGKNVGNWLYVTYNGVTGYAYGKYIKTI